MGRTRKSRKRTYTLVDGDTLEVGKPIYRAKWKKTWWKVKLLDVNKKDGIYTVAAPNDDVYWFVRRLYQETRSTKGTEAEEVPSAHSPEGPITGKRKREDTLVDGPATGSYGGHHGPRHLDDYRRVVGAHPPPLWDWDLHHHVVERIRTV